MDIQSLAIEFFGSLFGYSDEVAPLDHIPFPIPIISQQQRDMLDVLPLEEEVKEVVFCIDKDSAIGSDGYSALFYQTC